jgi:hypothetical protein
MNDLSLDEPGGRQFNAITATAPQPKSEILRKIFDGRPVPALTKFAAPVDTDPNSVLPLKTDCVIEVFPVTKAPTELIPPVGVESATSHP